MIAYPSERPVAWVEILLKFLIWLNWISGAVLAAFMVVTIAFADQLIGKAGADGITPDNIAILRLALLIALIMVPLAHVVLTQLRAIVATVGAGDPFVAVNARRLIAIAWALLGIMICDLAFGFLAMKNDPQMGWSFSLTGWLAVLLLFVLARVFDHGTRLRDEIEGTV